MKGKELAYVALLGLAGLTGCEATKKEAPEQVDVSTSEKNVKLRLIDVDHDGYVDGIKVVSKLQHLNLNNHLVKWVWESYEDRFARESKAGYTEKMPTNVRRWATQAFGATQTLEKDIYFNQGFIKRWNTRKAQER